MFAPQINERVKASASLALTVSLLTCAAVAYSANGSGPRSTSAIEISTLVTGQQQKEVDKPSITLTKRARENGYNEVKAGKGQLRFTAYNVIDPLTRKKLEGEHEVEIKCDARIFKETLLFTRGTTSPPLNITCSSFVERAIVLGTRFQQ